MSDQDKAIEMWNDIMKVLDKSMELGGVATETPLVGKYLERAVLIADYYLKIMGFEPGQIVMLADFTGWVHMVEKNKRATNRTLVMCQNGARMAMEGLGSYPEDGRNN